MAPRRRRPIAYYSSRQQGVFYLSLTMDKIYTTQTLEKIGELVTVSGWAETIRDHGQLIFIDLRDSKGVLQLVFSHENTEVFNSAKEVGREYVIKATGTIRERSSELVNEKLTTGKIELVVKTVEILNTSKPLPFPIDDDGRSIDENMRLKYRYIDLRRERLQRIVKQKHDLILAIRNWMDKKEFVEVITPLLTSTSPEGARDYYIPSRIHLGKYFVLPQAPQQFKQLLMVGGLDKYFQVAPCARDEDPRADRHAGVFYQIDMEMSFAEKEDVWAVCEQMLHDTYKTVAPNKTIMQYPFPRISHKDSLERYGCDKPDLRFGMELVNITDIVKGHTDFNIFNQADVVKCIVASGDKEWSRTEIGEMEDFAKANGAGGLAYVKVTEGGLDTGISKFLTSVANQITEVSKAKPGDIIFFGAGEKNKVNKVMASVRNKLGEVLGLTDPNVLAFAWITDFPFYERDDKTGKLDFGHNPFSMPQGGLKAFETEDPLSIVSDQYDLALNGYEILSGSIRNHNPEILLKAFTTLGYKEEDIKKKFGALYTAFRYGAPPHGGWAIGIDRYFMVLIDEPNIRDVYAFPMNSNGEDVMMGAPSFVDEADLEIVGVTMSDKAKRMKNRAEEKGEQD